MKWQGSRLECLTLGTGPFQHGLHQILACTLHENLVPNINRQQSILSSSGNQESKTVPIASLIYIRETVYLKYKPVSYCNEATSNHLIKEQLKCSLHTIEISFILVKGSVLPSFT